MSQSSSAPFSMTSESGKATTVAMLACLISMVFYLRIGRVFFVHELGPVHDAATLAVLTLISVFTIGCVLHMMILGEMSMREFRRKLEEEAESAAKFSVEVAKELEILERQCCIYNGSLGNVTIRALGTARRISMALLDRSRQVEALIGKRSSAAWLEAGELLRQPLRTDGDCCRMLIVGEPIAPIDEEELVPLLKALFSDIEYGITRSASFEPRFSADAFPEYAGLEELEVEPRRARRPTVH